MNKAIITGASSGLGHEIANKLISQGTKVINLSRTPSNLFFVTNIKTDLTKNEAIENVIKLIKKNHSDFDTIVFCTGVHHQNNIGEFPTDEIDDDFAANITGTIKLTNGLMSIIKENKGDVVIIGSTCSKFGFPKSSVYISTKHAVLGFIRALQAEYKKEDVRIIGIHPGGFNSPLQTKSNLGIDPKDLMNPENIAGLIINILKLPRNIEVSEIIINRKANGKTL